MEKKVLEALFERSLVVAGFRKKGSCWYRQLSDILQLIDLQKSSYGKQFYINIACVPRGMQPEGMPFPQEHKCPIRIRLTSAFPAQRERVDKSLDLENGDLASKREEEFNGSSASSHCLFCSMCAISIV